MDDLRGEAARYVAALVTALELEQSGTLIDQLREESWSERYQRIESRQLALTEGLRAVASMRAWLVEVEGLLIEQATCSRRRHRDDSRRMLTVDDIAGALGLSRSAAGRLIADVLAPSSSR